VELVNFVAMYVHIFSIPNWHQVSFTHHRNLFSSRLLSCCHWLWLCGICFIGYGSSRFNFTHEL